MSSPHPPSSDAVELNAPEQRQGIRNRRWLGILVVAVGIAAAGLFMPIPHGHRAFGAIGDLFHGPLFACLTFILLVTAERLRPITGWTTRFFVRTSMLALLMFGLGWSVEWFQSALGRTMAMHDGIANGFGILAAVGVFCIYRGRELESAPTASSQPHRLAIRKSTEYALISCSVMCLLSSWITPAGKLIDVANVYWQFPTLSSFESKYEIDRWYLRDLIDARTDRDPTHGEHGLELTVAPSRKPSDPALCGATLFELNSDWSSMSALLIDVRMAEQTAPHQCEFAVQVVCETSPVGDTDQGRPLIQTATVNVRGLPGQWSTIRITRDDILAQVPSFDFTSVRYLDLFMKHPQPNQVWWLDHVRLDGDFGTLR
ncbi:MAG: hypothetical protein AAF745_04905 [Planctomycetota bacterium]